MRNRILGAIGVIWGGASILRSLLRGGVQGEGAYATGQLAGMVLGGLLFSVGLYYLIKGSRAK